MTDLPFLLDRAAVRRLLGLTRVDVDRAFRAIPVVSPPGSRKVYVRRDDLLTWIDQSTTHPGEIRHAA